MESTGLEPFREQLKLLTQHEPSDLEGAKLSPTPFDKTIKDEVTWLKSTSDVQVSGNFTRACRICNKQFSSGRALGGHMRVHGPHFTVGSMSSRGSYGFPALNLTRAREEEEEQEEEQEFTRFNDDEDEGSPSVVDELDAESDQKDFLLRGHASSMLQASSSRKGDDKVTLYHCDNVYGEVDADNADDGEEEEEDLNSIERRSLTFKFNPKISCSAGRAEEATAEENFTASRKSLSLYQLRHNPKRSRWLAEQEFAASIDHSGTSLSVIEAAGCVCSECGKAFWSERALFGHMRCHPDREKRGMISPESSSELSADAKLARNHRKRISVAGKFIAGSSKMQIGSKIRPDDSSKRGTMEIEPRAVSRKESTPTRFEVTDVNPVADEREAEVMLGVEELDGCIKSFPGMLSDDIAPARWQSAGKRSRRKVGLSKAETMEIRETSSSTPEDEPALTSETISLELGEEEQEIGTPDFLILLAEAAKKIEEDAALPISKQKYPRVLKNVSSQPKDLHQMNGDHHHNEEENSGEDEGVPSAAHDYLVAGDINGKYECTTCKKSFNSHQALGGHRASHKKTKGCFARTGSSAEASEEHSFDEEQLEIHHAGLEKGMPMMMMKKRRRKQEETQQVAAGDFKGHACSICHRVFLTGQALGGHKRCHWTGEKLSETLASVASTTKQPSMQSGQSMVEGGIDLNLPAPIGEDADADEVGFGSMNDEIRSIRCKILDQESEVEKQAGTANTELALGSSMASQAWARKGLLKDGSSSDVSLQKSKQPAGHRFEGIWGQHRPNNNIVGVPCHALPDLLFS